MKIQDYNQMMAYLTRPATPTETPDIRQPAASGGRIGYNPGGLVKVYQLLKNLRKTGPIRGLEERLIKKFKATGMEFIEAVDKAHTQAAGVRYEAKMKIINDAMKNTDVYSDDYVDLLDMKIKIEDPDFAKEFVKFPENLKNKTRSRNDPDWAEANFGEEYGTKLDQARSKEINEAIDPNFKEPLSPSDQMVSDIDDMNVANTDEFFGRKKNASGGRIGLALGTEQGTTIMDNLKGKGGSLLRTAERIFGPAGTAVYYAATQTVPDVTNAEELIIPAFWNMIMKQYKWSDKSTDPLKKRIINAAKRGLIPTNLMPAISRASGIGSGLMAAKYVMTESEPNVLQGKFDPEKADQVFPALIEGYEKKFTGKDQSPYMDFSGGMLKMKDPDDLKMTYRNNQAMDIKDVIQEYNNGGRVGYADGPKDPKRRTVIKGLTALAALPVIGKYFKLAPKAGKIATVAMEKVSGMPNWFQPFVNKVLKMGDDVTDTAATTEREIVKRMDIEDATVDVHYNTATNDVRVEVAGGNKNAFGDPLTMEYKAPEVIEQTGKKTKGEFKAVETKPEAVQAGPDDFDLEPGENVTDVLDDLLSETDYLEGFTTGKIRTPNEIKKAKKRTFHRDNMEKNPKEYILSEDMANFSNPDAKAYETITDLDEMDYLLDLAKKKK